MTELRRRQNESEFQHHKRLVHGKLVDKSLSDADYTELAEQIYGQPYASDVARRMMYGSARTLAMLERNIVSDTVDEDMLASLEEKKIELQKERVKLQTEKMEYNRWLREDAREELFAEKIINAIKSTDTDCAGITPIISIPDNREHILCLADFHFGKDFQIHGLKDEILNEYSPEIFYERMSVVLGETVEFIKKENVSVIRVLELGDELDGFLRNSQAWTLRYGVVESAIIFSKYMAEWLKELSKHVFVEYHPVNGNHTTLRLLDGKKDEHLNENISNVVSEIIRIRNENNPNFKIRTNKTGMACFEVCGFNVLGIHGEVKSLAQAIKDFSDIYGEKVDVLITGHKHHGSFINCGYRRQAIGIGSIVGSDDFSMRIKKQADATANILTFCKGKGCVNNHIIYLN